MTAAAEALAQLQRLGAPSEDTCDAAWLLYDDIKQAFLTAMQARRLSPFALAAIVDTVDDYMVNHYGLEQFASPHEEEAS